jgi:protein-S-isoprenylcysteine O-methyltransferase Ste14
MINSNARRRPVQAIDSPMKGEWPTRVAVSVWFFVLASLSVNQILATRAAPLDLLAIARLLSTVSLISFFLMIAWLTLVRPQPIAKASGWMPRVAAILGTWLFLLGAPLLSRRNDLGAAPLLVSAFLIVAGNILAVLILRRLGRSFSIMAEARRLVTSGPYSVVRHPLYGAELVGLLGVLIQFASWEAVSLVAVQFGFQLIRMRNEEAVLIRSFPEYATYMLRTPRLIPRIW